MTDENKTTTPTNTPERTVQREDGSSVLQRLVNGAWRDVGPYKHHHSEHAQPATTSAHAATVLSEKTPRRQS